MSWFSIVFLGALLASTVVRLWLARRHIAHIERHRKAVPQEFADVIPLSAHQKAADYTIAKTRLGATEIIVSAVLLIAFTFGGGLQALADLWSAVLAPEGIAHGVAVIASVAAIEAIVDLPFSAYQTFGIESRFGFNRMTVKLFIADLLRSVLVAAAFGIPLLVLVLWLMAKMGEYWWLYVWLAWMAFNLFLLWVYPTVIAPLFNKFTPLEDEGLRRRIERLLARCGFRSRGVFVMDGSKRSSHGNAYFTGFGDAKRIVFFDTLLARLSPAEVEAVLAHELGHFQRRHITKRIAWVFAGSLVLLALLGYLIDQPWFYASLGVETRTTAMGLALFFLVIPVLTFPLAPLRSLYSRKHEYEADEFAVEHADRDDLVRALVKLYQDNAATLTPDPLHSAFYDSHPPAALRIARLQGQGA